VEPSKGYIPVLSGNFEMKYEFSLLEYKQSGVFYSTGVIENFYEMKYEDPPTEAELINAKPMMITIMIFMCLKWSRE